MSKPKTKKTLFSKEPPPLRHKQPQLTLVQSENWEGCLILTFIFPNNGWIYSKCLQRYWESLCFTGDWWTEHSLLCEQHSSLSFKHSLGIGSTVIDIIRILYNRNLCTSCFELKQKKKTNDKKSLKKRLKRKKETICGKKDKNNQEVYSDMLVFTLFGSFRRM